MTGPLTQTAAEQMSLQDLGDQSHFNLLLLRKILEQQGNTALDTKLSAPEHQAFAREYTQESPVSGALGLGLVGIPAYQIAKIFGLDHTVNQDGGPSTPPSLDQFLAGYKGIGQGLQGAWKNLTTAPRTTGTDTAK